MTDRALSPAVTREDEALEASIRPRTLDEYLGQVPVREQMQRNLEARLRIQWRDLHVPTLAAGLGTPALLIHDRQDDYVAAADSAAIAAAWPGTSLLLTGGLGHRSIIHDPAVVSAAAEFIAGR